MSSMQSSRRIHGEHTPLPYPVGATRYGPHTRRSGVRRVVVSAETTTVLTRCLPLASASSSIRNSEVEARNVYIPTEGLEPSADTT